ncbi:MAG TPA: low temperature requirement protein A [Devosia sp.]|nr:low temperature requirement protein A [Devosia sp.]
MGGLTDMTGDAMGGAAEGLFRVRSQGEAPVTPAELFFDLVFVFAVTQVSHFLLDHLGWLGAVEAAILLLAVWSSWVDTVLITNLLDPGRQPVRAALFALMAVGLVFSSALPEAFAERGLVFGTAFALFQFGRTVFMVWATRSRPKSSASFLRTAVWVAIYGAFWIAGGFAEGPARFACWSLALLIDYLMPVFGYPVPGLGRTAFEVLAIEGAHVAERVSLFVMIALGESVLVTGATFAALEWTPPVVIAVASGLVQSAAMWWIYFYWSSESAKTVIARASDPSVFIIRAFGYVPWIVVAGIVIAAVGDDLTLGDPLATPDVARIWVLIGGPALFVLGALLFEYGALGKWSRIRLAALAALALLVPLAPRLTSLGLSLATTTLIVAVAIAEHIWFSQRRVGLSGVWRGVSPASGDSAASRSPRSPRG